MKIINLAKLIIFFNLCLLPIIGLANTMIKVAILDNFDDKSMAYNYANAYMSGISTAIIAANNKGYTVEYREFLYNNSPLAIMNQIPKVKAWDPDVVIGPHFSNQFLLLKDYFPETLVLSSYASDQELQKMPINFYSLAWSDNSVKDIVIKFISQNLPNRNLFTLVEADCKDCVDFSALLSKQYAEANPGVSVNQASYLQENIDNLNIPVLMNSYHQGDVIILEPSTYEYYQQLLYRISNYLNDDPIFINNMDSYGDIGQEVSNRQATNYTEYWIVPYFFDDKSVEYQQYKKITRQYHKASNNKISYEAYLTLRSAIEAIETYPQKANLPIKQQILQAYVHARQVSSNWFRMPYFSVYKIDKTGYKLVSEIPAA